MECRNPVGESPTSCALVLFEKSNLMHQRKAVWEGDTVFERTVDEILGRNEVRTEGATVECVTTLR